ncbi:MAG: preprotein translocase subunit YajC, partial [Actinomycetota bacterium]
MNQQLILLLVVMAALFYLLIFRPQQRAKRQREELDRSLDVGGVGVDRRDLAVQAADGDDAPADVEIADGVVVTFDRRAISATARPEDEAADEDEDDEDDEDYEDDEDDEDDEDLGDEADEVDAEAVADAAAHD